MDGMQLKVGAAFRRSPEARRIALRLPSCSHACAALALSHECDGLCRATSPLSPLLPRAASALVCSARPLRAAAALLLSLSAVVAAGGGGQRLEALRV